MLPSAHSQRPGKIREPGPPSSELQWLCTTGHLSGRRCSVYWPTVDAWYHGDVGQCRPGAFKMAYDAADGEEPLLVWESLGSGVHLEAGPALPVGETRRRIFRTRSRVAGADGVLKRPGSFGKAAGVMASRAGGGHKLQPFAPKLRLDAEAASILMLPEFRDL